MTEKIEGSPLVAGNTNSDLYSKDSSKNKNNSRWFLLGFPVTTVTLAAFYAQGRAYIEGYITRFGLDISLFSISIDDIYWYAFVGWLSVADILINNIINVYPQYIYKILTACVIFFLILWISKKISWKIRYEKILSKIRRKRFFNMNLDFGFFTWFFFVPSMLMSTLPIMLISIMGIALTMVFFFIMPFSYIGSKDAEKDYENLSSNHSLVRYINRTENIDNIVLSAKFLKCSSSFCLVIKDDKPFVIKQSDIVDVEGVIK